MFWGPTFTFDPPDIINEKRFKIKKRQKRSSIYPYPLIRDVDDPIDFNFHPTIMQSVAAACGLPTPHTLGPCTYVAWCRCMLKPVTTNLIIIKVPLLHSPFQAS